MNRARRIFFRSLAAFFALLAAAFAALYLNGTCFRKFQGADPALSDWMARLPDDMPINRIIIPGSHDAGTKGMLWAAETQNCTVGEQLLSGARYFDIRVHKKGSRLVIFHSFIDGGDFGDVLSEIREFLAANKSEVLLLDFQHFKGNSQEEVYARLLQELGETMLVKNDTEQDDADFIRNLKLGDARGKCILFWGDRSSDTSEYLFLRNDDECTKDGMCLDSYYIGEKHKAGTAVLTQEAHPVYFGHLEEKKAAGTNAVFVLQCQLTDGKILLGPWSLERKNDPVMSEYIRGLQDSPRREDLNIILRDFLTPEKCRDIIRMNDGADTVMPAGSRNP